MKKIAIFLLFGILLYACKNEEGDGGASVIEGRVYQIYTFQNSQTGLMDTLYYQLDAGKDVYIIYSNDELAIYDDKFETDYLGGIVLNF